MQQLYYITLYTKIGYRLKGGSKVLTQYLQDKNMDNAQNKQCIVYYV